MNRRTSLAAAALATGLALSSLPASAQYRKPEDAVKYRQSVMAVQGHHVGRLFAMANGRMPFDAKVAAEEAELVLALSRYKTIGFVDGTADVTGSRARPEIWRERAKFDGLAQRNAEDVARMAAAAKTGDVAQLRTAVGAVGGSCKACHDDFQKQ